MTISTEGTPYGVLGVPFNASSSDIKKAYRMVSFIWRLDPSSFVCQ
jgi:curved DNA-binding protein CbpA